jgi:hypothetical protein
MTADGAVTSPGDLRQRCEPPTALAADPAPPRRDRPRKASKEGFALTSLQMGCIGREVVAGGNQRGPHPTLRLVPSAPASPEQVAQRARTLVAGSAVAMAGSPAVPGVASSSGPPPLGSRSAGVSLSAGGCSGLRCSVELPAPMAAWGSPAPGRRVYASWIRRDGDRSAETAPARSQDALLAAVLLWTRPDCEWRRRALGKLLKRKKKKKKKSQTQKITC